MDKFSILKQYFGHTVFRPGQEPLIDGILTGRDVLGVMPTGSGKSLCYQIPALLMPGLTLVVSPLISLMKDQVAALLGVGVKAAFINSSLTSDQLQTVYQRLREDSYKIVYIAPERLASDGFVRLMQEQKISLVAGRSPLYFPMGTGFSPQLSKNRGISRKTAVSADFVRLYRHSHGSSAPGYYRYFEIKCSFKHRHRL